VLLERRNEISPRIGQSIAAEPNGSRVCLQFIPPTFIEFDMPIDSGSTRASGGVEKAFSKS
jgi:hypothetical protein